MYCIKQIKIIINNIKIIIKTNRKTNRKTNIKTNIKI
jgi:hypothetical protein